MLRNLSRRVAPINIDQKRRNTMHDFKIPDHIVKRVVARRGRAHIHDDLEPSRTALLVVDLQNGFMVEEYAANPVAEAINIVPNVNRLADAVRATGGKVFWIRNTVDKETEKNWSQWYDMSAGDPQRAAKRTAALQKDSPGHQLYADLVVRPQDETVLKYRFSAFIQGSSDLHERLQAQGFDTVIITGTVTGVCCDSTARDAMMLNYKTIMVSDGNAAMTDAEHNASLSAFYSIFGDVMDTDMLVGCLHNNVKAEAAG
jgi:ureidoacrylate peracid hydrolase